MRRFNIWTEDAPGAKPTTDHENLKAETLQEWDDEVPPDDEDTGLLTAEEKQFEPTLEKHRKMIKEGLTDAWEQVGDRFDDNYNVVSTRSKKLDKRRAPKRG